MKTKVTKPNFRVKHPYGYLIKSMLIGLILVFTSILSMATGIVNLNPKSTSEAADNGNWSDSVTSTYNASSSTHGFASGTGTYSNPFVIKTIAQWRCFADFVYNWNGGYGYYFSLGADLDFSDGRMEDGIFSVGNTNSNENRLTVSTNISVPSGKATSVSSSTKAKSFAGVFWGNGYRIGNISAYNTVNFRLFASIAGISNVQTSTSVSTSPNYSLSYYATGVYDLVLYNIDLDFDASWAGAGDYYGILAGKARRAVISNVFVYFDEGGYEFHSPDNMYIGGLVGGIEGCQIYGCKVSGFWMRGIACVGGIVGGILSTNNYGNNYIINCHNAAGVYVSDEMGENFGGIIGCADSSSSSYLVIRNCWNTGVVTTWSTLGSSSTDGNTELLIDNASMAGIAGGTITGGSSSYVYILNSYNSGRVYASSYVGGSSTELNGYGIAGAYTKISNSSASNYKNYYLSGLQTNTTTSYESSLALSGFNTVSTSGLGVKNSYSGCYYSGITASDQQSGDIQYAYPTHSIFPVSSYTNVSGSTLSNVTVSKETGTVNYRQVGTTVAKKVYVTTEANSGVTVSKSNMTLHSSSSGVYNLTRLPNNTYASSVTITGEAGYKLNIAVSAYSTKGSVTSTIYTESPTSTTASASKTISFNKDDIREYSISVSSVKNLEGSGTASSPYLIKDADDLKAIYSYDGPSVYFALTSDITVSDTSYLNECNSIIQYFEGILDGRGYTIDLSAINYCSLFTYYEGFVYNLNIVAKLNMKAYTTDELIEQVGGSGIQDIDTLYTETIGFVLACSNLGTIDNVNLYVKGSADIKYLDWGNGQYNVNCGLLVGTNSGTIKNCYVGPYDAGLDYINSQGTMDKGVSFANIYISHETLSCTDLYVGGICGLNSGSLIGNSTSLIFYDMDSIIDDVIDNGYNVYVGGIVGYDSRSDADYLLADNYAEGQNQWGPSNYPNEQYSAGGIAGYIGGSGASASNIVRNVSFCYMGGYPYVDYIAGYTNITGLDAHNFAIGSSNNNNGSGGNTHTSLYSTSITYSMYGDESENFDPEYWIALSGNESITGYLDGFYIDGEIFYPRSKKPFGSTVQSNNWTKNNDASLTLNTSTTAVNISNALQLGKLAQMINEKSDGYYSSLKTINITADIYMYGKYWTPINYLDGVTINGNNHTIYGLDSVGTNSGGLVNMADNLEVNNLNFEDCMITGLVITNNFFYYQTKGFIANWANSDDQDLDYFRVDNVQFTNCHMYFSNSDSSIALVGGFIVGSLGGASYDSFTLKNVTIGAEYAGSYWGNSSIVQDKSADYSDIGGLVGYNEVDYVYISGLIINGLDMYCTDSYVDIGGLVGDNEGVVEITDSYIVALNIIISTSDNYESNNIGGLVGYIYGDVNVQNCIIDINITFDGTETEHIFVGGIIGYDDYAGNVVVESNDINISINQLSSHSASYYSVLSIGGVIGYCSDVVPNIIMQNNIFRLDSNMFQTSSLGATIGNAGTNILGYGDSTTTLKNNIFYISANDYSRITLTSTAYSFGSDSMSHSNNVFYFANGSAGTIRLYSESGTWTTATTLTTTQMAGLVNGGGSLVGNDFFENKFIKSNWNNDGPLVQYFSEGGTEVVVPFKNYTDPHFYVPLIVNGVGFEVYNVLENYTQIAAYDNISTSDTTVTVVRNGQYTLPYTAAGTKGNIYLLADDSLTFKLNNSSYKFTASYDGYTSSTKSTDISTIVSESTSSYTHTVPSSMATNTYWTDGGSKFVAVQVDISQAARYFAVESTMTVSGATLDSIRGSYKVYKANIGASVTISKSGNTSGYSTSAGSYITGITQGTLNTSNLLTSTTSKTTSNSLTFTVSSSNTSSASTGSIVGYGYSTETMQLHTITNNASLGSGSVYFTTSITGTNKYTSLYLKKGVTVTYHYPSTSGEWENPTVSRTGSYTSATSTGYTTTSGTCTSTVTYSKKTYQTTIHINQELASKSDTDVYYNNISGTTNASSLAWGAYDSSLLVSDYQGTAEGSCTWGVLNTKTDGIRKSAYVTIDGKNFVGQIDTISHNSKTEAVVKNTSITNATVHYPAGYKVNSITYNGTSVSFTTNSTNNTATFSFTITGAYTLKIDVDQDKWDDSSNISTPSGDGSSDNPYKISSASEYGWMINKINAGTHNGKYFQITQDIDLSAKFVSPINSFGGTIDGTDSLHSIKNMRIYTDDGTAFIEQFSGTLKNVIFVDPIISTRDISTSSTVYFIQYTNGNVENVGIRNDTAGTGFISNNVCFFGDVGGDQGYYIASVFNEASVYVYNGGIVEFGGGGAGNIHAYYSAMSVNKLTSNTSVNPSTYEVFSGRFEEIVECIIRTDLSGITFSSKTIFSDAEVSGSVYKVYYLSGESVFSLGSTTALEDMDDITAKTAAQLKSADTFTDWNDDYWTLSPSNVVNNIYRGQKYDSANKYPLLIMPTASGMTFVTFYYKIYSNNGSVTGKWESASSAPGSYGWTLGSYGFQVRPNYEFGFTVIHSGNYAAPLYLTSITAYTGFSKFTSPSSISRYSTATYSISDYAFNSSTASILLTFSTSTSTFVADVNSVQSGLATGTHENQTVTASTSTSSNVVAKTYTYGLNSSYGPLVYESFAVENVTILSGHSTTKATKYIYKNGSTYYSYDSKQTSSSYTFVGRVDITPTNMRSGTITLYDLKEDIKITAKVYIAYAVSYSGLARNNENNTDTNTIKTYYSTSAITTGTTSVLQATVRNSGSGNYSGSTGTLYAPVANGTSPYYIGSVLAGNNKSYTWGTMKHNSTTDATNSNFTSTANAAHSVKATDLANTTSSVASLVYTYGPGEWKYTFKLKLYVETKPEVVRVNVLDHNGEKYDGVGFATVVDNATTSIILPADLYDIELNAIITVPTGKQYRVVWGDVKTGSTANPYPCDPPTQDRTYVLNIIEQFYASIDTTFKNTYDGIKFKSTYSNVLPTLTIEFDSTSLYAGGTGTSWSSIATEWTTNNVLGNYEIDYGAYIKYSTAGTNKIATATLASKIGNTYDTQDVYFNDIYSVVGSSEKEITSATTSAQFTRTFEYQINVRTIDITIKNQISSKHPNNYIGVTLSHNTSVATQSGKNWLYGSTTDTYVIYYKGLFNSSGSALEEDTTTNPSSVRGYRYFYVVGGENIKVERGDGNQNSIQSITYSGGKNLFFTYNDDTTSKLIGRAGVIKENSSFSFTYYPYVTMGVKIDKVTTSAYAGNNDCLNASVSIGGMTPKTDTSTGYYIENSSLSYTNTNGGTFETPVYICLTVTVPDITGWTFNGWYLGGTQITDNKDVYKGTTTTKIGVYKVSMTSSGNKRVYTLKFPCEIDDTDTIKGTTYNIKFTENTYTITANSYLTSGGSRSTNNGIAYKWLYQYSTSSYGNPAIVAGGTTSTEAISYTAGYFGYYQIKYLSIDSNTYYCVSGDADINKQTSTYASIGEFKKWHTITVPSTSNTTVTYTTTDYSGCHVTSSNYTYTIKTSKSEDAVQIATITLSGMTDKGGALKVLEGNTLTASYTINTNKFNGAVKVNGGAISSGVTKTVTADTSITSAFAENVYSLKFYKNTESSTQVGETLTLGSLNKKTDISGYNTSPGDEYSFKAWTTAGSLSFDHATQVSTSIVERSLNGTSGTEYKIYANWLHDKQYTFTTSVSTTYKTSGKTSENSGAGGTLSLTSYNNKATDTPTATATADTGYNFVDYTVTNGKASGNVIKRSGSNFDITNGTISYTNTNTTYYVSGSILYQDAAHLIYYSDYDYSISGSTVTIYDKTEVTVVANFVEKTFDITIKQPSGGEITITNHTSSVPSIQYTNSLPTQITVGYFSKIELTYTNTKPAYRFKAWTFDSSKYTYSSSNGYTATFGANIIGADTISVAEYDQREIAINAPLVRYKSSSTPEDQTVTLSSVVVNNGTITFTYSGYYTITIKSNGTAIETKVNEEGTKTYYIITNGDEIVTTFTSTDNTKFYSFTTPGGKTLSSAGTTTDGYILSGTNKDGTMTVKFSANTTSLPNTSNTITWRGVLKDEIAAKDDTNTSSNEKVYVASQNQASVKVAEGESVKIVAEDYTAENSATKAYKFSHWTFSGTDWMSSAQKTSKSVDFVVYANRAGTYTAHYKYAYKVSKFVATTNGTTFGTTNCGTTDIAVSGNASYTDSTYLVGSTVTLTATLDSNYAYYGWYLYHKTNKTYTAITSSTTGVTSILPTTLTFTVGGIDCDNKSYQGIDLENYTIVYGEIKLHSYQFGGMSDAPSATYEVTGTGVYSVTGGTTATMTATGGTFMTVYIKEGTTATFTVSKLSSGTRTNGVLYYKSNVNQGSISSITLTNGGLGGLTFSLIANEGTTGKYEAQYQTVYSIINLSSATVTDTHVTDANNHTDNVTNSIISISASTVGTAGTGVTYYDSNTVITLSASIPTGHQFVKWVINDPNGTTYTTQTYEFKLTASITSIALYIKEIEYEISTQTNVSIPAGFISSGSSATTWTSDSFGTFAYTKDSSTTKIGYFGTITIGSFTSGNKLYINGGKAYYDSEYKHAVNTNNYSISGSTLTYLGNSYTISNNVATIWNLYINPTYTVSTGTGTLSGSTIESVRSNITITCTVEMQGKLRSKGLNRKDSAVIVTAKENTIKAIDTVTYTAETKTGYVFKGWAVYNNSGGRITATGAYYNTNTSITVKLTEENNGYTYVAEYNPTFSLTVSANDFEQGSITATIGGEAKTAITAKTTYSDIEWGTSITLKATAKDGYRTDYWTGTNGNNKLGSELDTLSFEIDGTVTATHNFLKQYKITITHNKNLTTGTGGTWTIQEYRKGDDNNYSWANVTNSDFVGKTGSKTFTLADAGTQYRVVVTTSTHHYVVLSTTGTTSTIDNSGAYSMTGTVTSFATFDNGEKGMTEDSTVTITHTGLNYVYIDTSTSGLKNTVTVDADYLNVQKSGTGTLGTSSSPIVLKNDGSTTITTTAVAGYDNPTWNDGTTKSLTYTLANNSLGTTYHVTIKYPNNYEKTINLTVVGYTGEFKYASIVSGSAQNTQTLKHAYEVNGLSLKEGLTALRFSDFNTNIVSSVKVSDGTNTYTGTSSVDYTIPTGTDTISLTLTVTNNTWIDNYTEPSGSGTSADPYKIAKASDFAWIAHESAKSTNANNFAGKYFIQTGNIDLSGHLWVPIQNFNGVFVGSHSYSIKNITTSDEKYNFADTSISNNLYYSMSLFANSNGGVFKTLKITDYNNTSWVTKVLQLESHAVLLAKGTDVVIDGIILDNVVLESNTYNNNSGLLVASLTGGKISNVEFDERSSYIYNTFETSGESISTPSTFGYNAGLVGETKASTKTYVDSNGNRVNVVIENIKMYDGIISKINSGNAPSFIVGINTSTLSLNNIYVNNTNTDSASNIIYYSALFNTNSGTITAQNIVINSKSSSMSTYDTMIGTNTGTLTCTDVYGTYKFSTSSDTYSGYTKTSTFTSAFNTLYNKGGNVWYKGGMDIFGEYTTSSSDDAVTITSGVIQLSGNITMAKFKNALSALSTNSSVTKVELLSDIDFGGATLDTSYSIPAGKTFDGHGYTISGIKTVRRVTGSESTVSGIFNTISGTLKRVVFNNIYVYVLPTSTTSVSYQHVAIIGGYNSGITMERVTVKNSRLNVAYDGLVGKESNKPTMAVFGASVGSGSITYVDIVNTKITVSNYGTSSTEAFKIGGLVGYVTVPVSNVQIGTDIIVDSNSTGHLVSGVAGYSSATMSNIAVKGNITATNSKVYTISGAGSTTISTAFVSGTFSPKATALNANCTATNVYISANASSASGTKSDAQMKTQSTYSGFDFTNTNSGDTLTWYMNTYPTFTVQSNHMKVGVTLSGDGAISGPGNSITLNKRNSSEDSHGIVTLTSAGSTSRLYSANSGDYNYVLKVVTVSGFTLNLSSCTNDNNETVDLNDIMSSTTDEYELETIYTINTSYSKYDLNFNFEIVKNDYTVSVNVVGHGTVTGAGSYKTGDLVTLTATPSASTSHTEHHFIGWYRGSTRLSTSTTYTFSVTEGTAGTYQAKFCSDASGNCKFKATASMSSGSQSTVSPSDTGWVVGGGTGSAYEKTFTVTLADGEEITKITRDGTQIYSKVGGVTNTSLYTATTSSSMFTLKVLINSTTKGAYIFTTGATSQVVTINIPNVGGSTRSETDAYSAHGIINLSTSSTSSTIAANATTGTISVIYGQTLTISFMSNIRYKLGSIETTVSGGNTNFTSSTSTVSGYTRYTYSYTTNAITSDTTITLNLVKDRWVDFTSSTSYTAGHSTEFITANGGTASNEISSSSATFGSDKKYKGTEANPFVISTAAQLARVSYLVNINASFMTYKGSTLTQVYYKDACYKITADIDLNNYFWTPINMRGSENIKMSIVSEQQSVISNMYLRYDKEEYALDSSFRVYDNLAFIMGDAGMITGITFDGAVVYNSSVSGYSGVVSTNSSSMLNFITVKNSNIYTASYAGVVVGRANIMSLLNYINSVSNTITTISDVTVGLGMYAGGIVGCVTNASLEFDTLPTVASLGINNVSVSGLKIKNTTSYGLYAGGIVVYSDSVVIIDSIVHGITTEGNNITLSNISTYDMYGNDYQNVWSASSANFNSLYRDDPVNTYSGTPNLSALGFSSDTWYVSNGVALTKGYSTGTNSIGNIADVTSGGFAGGTGTKEDPYLISNATQFRYLQYLVNSGNTTYNSASKYYKITADLDLGGGISTIMGIGHDNYGAENSNKKFKANLDGDFHTISNMFVFDPYNTNYVGFVAYSDRGSTIKNLNLDNYTIIAKANVGGIVGSGKLGVNIDNVGITNAVVVGSSSYTAGIVADVINNSQNAIIKNAAFDGTIISDASKAIGGIVGYINYNNNVDYNIYIQNCHSDGTILSSGRNISLSIGGILGQSENTTFEVITYISDCYNNMSLLSGAGMMGGIVGYTSNTEIKNCYNNGELIISSCQFAGSYISSYYNSNTDYNNGDMSIATNTVAFYGEIVGRNFNNTINTTIIIDSKFNESKKIVGTKNSGTGLLLPYGDRNILGHTPNGYGMYTNSSISGSYTDAIGSAEMKNADAMTEIGNFSSWDRYTIWYFDGTNLPVHRWNTQNRQYFEGSGLDISQDGNSVIVENGKITFADGIMPVKDSDGRVYVYVSGSSLNMTFVPDENFALETAQLRDYYSTTYSAFTGSSVNFVNYSDGMSFKVMKVSFANSKFTITVNTSLSRGSGIAVGEYETLHIVILNTTTNVAYTCTLDDGTYVFDELTAGTYYVAVYTSMFFDVSNISCTTEGITFGEVQFYRTLVLSNSTSANAIINITANKTVDAWIYSKVEIGA